VTQVADSTTTADDTDIVTDTKDGSLVQHNDVKEITTNATPIVNNENLAINSSNGVRSYHHSFPALDIIEVVEVPPKQASLLSYHHSFPAVEIIEVVEATRNHVRKESTETNFSTQSQQTIDSEASSTTPTTPNTVYSIPDVNATNQLTPICAKELKEDNVLTPTAAVLTTPLDKARSIWYDYSHLSPEERVNIDTIYRMDENDNPLLMTQEEYEDLLAWFSNFEKKEDQVKLPPPVVLVTDEEGNERLAEEDDEASFVNQPEDCNSQAERTIAIVD
ncbi:hypothetical protein N0V85_006504, partial [Neurospora sp. IMI 360204]